MATVIKGTLKKESGVSDMSREHKSEEIDIYTVFTVCLALLVVLLVVIIAVSLGKHTYMNNHFFGDDYVVGETITSGYIKDLKSWVDTDNKEHYEVVVRGERTDGKIEERTFELTSAAYSRYNKSDYIEFDENGVELGTFKSNNEKK